MDIKEMKKDIIDYDLYHVADSIPYGNYQLSILNEGNKILIVVNDNKGSAAWVMDKEEFLKISTTEELKKHINSIIYYNYVEYERNLNEKLTIQEWQEQTMEQVEGKVFISCIMDSVPYHPDKKRFHVYNEEGSYDETFDITINEDGYIINVK